MKLINSTNPLETSKKQRWEPYPFYEASITQRSKLDRDIKRKLQTSISHEHRLQNPQQNINKSNPATYKKIIHHNQEGLFFLGIQGLV